MFKVNPTLLMQGRMENLKYLKVSSRSDVSTVTEKFRLHLELVFKNDCNLIKALYAVEIEIGYLHMVGLNTHTMFDWSWTKGESPDESVETVLLVSKCSLLIPLIQQGRKKAFLVAKLRSNVLFQFKWHDP